MSDTQYKWFKNGDHPDDDCEIFDAGNGPFQGEGKVVRYFRHPHIDGNKNCEWCGNIMHLHGWIDSGNGGETVCPGDIVVNPDGGDYTVIKGQPIEPAQRWISVYENPPEIGQWCWISDKGVVQREAWQWDAADYDYGLMYFWYRGDCDLMGPNKHQLWKPITPPDTEQERAND